MSTGLVICDVCKREVHQDGPVVGGKAVWVHCETGTPACQSIVYATPEQLRGKACYRDGR